MTQRKHLETELTVAGTAMAGMSGLVWFVQQVGGVPTEPIHILLYHALTILNYGVLLCGTVSIVLSLMTFI